MFDFPLFQNQQYPNYSQIQSNYQNQFIVKQVGNINEAKNAIINPLYPHLFIDYGTGNIYLKKMNNNGLTDFITYSPTEEPKQNDPFIQINERLSNIENKLGGINVQSISKSTTDDSATNDSKNATTKPSTV